MLPRTPRPDYISRSAVPLGDGWGTAYRLDSITTMTLRAVGNPAEIRFGTEDDGQPNWANDTLPLDPGIDTSIGGDRELENFSYFQLRNRNAGAPATCDIYAFCKGA